MGKRVNRISMILIPDGFGMVDLLARNGADMNIQSENGFTPVIRAAKISNISYKSYFIYKNLFICYKKSYICTLPFIVIISGQNHAKK